MSVAPTFPHDTEMEEYLIGASVISDACAGRLVDLAREGWFYHEVYRRLFQCIEAVKGAGDHSDPINVGAAAAGMFPADGQLRDYLMQAIDRVPFASESTVVSSCEKLRRMELRRRLMTECFSIIDRAQVEVDADAMVGELAQTVFDWSSGTTTRMTTIADMADEFLERIAKGPTKVKSVTRTGTTKLDQLIGGFSPGDLIYLAGRPSMGKTALALGWALHIAETAPVLVASMELPRQSVMERWVSQDGKIDGNLIRFGPGEDFDDAREDMIETAHRLRSLPIYVIDDVTSTTEVMAKAQAITVAEKRPLGAIIVDRIELYDDTMKGDNETAHLSMLSKSMNHMARRLNVPVICLVQLSRKCEERRDKRPMLSDLRMCGALEQDAKIVIGVYRDEYYEPESDKQGIAEILVLKNMDGATGSEEVAFRPEFAGFYDLDTRH